jgi:hypothetical protein
MLYSLLFFVETYEIDEKHGAKHAPCFSYDMRVPLVSTVSSPQALASDSKFDCEER